MSLSVNDPKFIFWLGVVVTTQQAIATGAVHLTHMVPDAWIPSITAWCAFLSFVGTGVMTGLTGFSSSKTGPLVGAPVPKSVPVILMAALVGTFALLLVATTSAWTADLAVPAPRPMVIGGPVGVGASPSSTSPRLTFRPDHRKQHR